MVDPITVLPRLVAEAAMAVMAQQAPLELAGTDSMPEEQEGMAEPAAILYMV
jgi:hypothetical protein